MEIIILGGPVLLIIILLFRGVEPGWTNVELRTAARREECPEEYRTQFTDPPAERKRYTRLFNRCRRREERWVRAVDEGRIPSVFSQKPIKLTWENVQGLYRNGDMSEEVRDWYERNNWYAPAYILGPDAFKIGDPANW